MARASYGDGGSQLELHDDKGQGPERTCLRCQKTIAGPFAMVDGAPYCTECYPDVLSPEPPPVSDVGRFLRATVQGTAAAIPGVTVYYAVLRMGFQASLVSILVGFLVGTAVRNGSQHHGGWHYQALAILLTYSAIVASFAAMIIPEAMAVHGQRRADQDAARQDERDKPGADAKKDARAVAGPRARRLPERPIKGEIALVKLLFLLIAFVGYLYTIPFQLCLKSPISFLIIGFGLWEAWKLNQRPAETSNYGL
jgi:hypothetical protein